MKKSIRSLLLLVFLFHFLWILYSWNTKTVQYISKETCQPFENGWIHDSEWQTWDPHCQQEDLHLYETLKDKNGSLPDWMKNRSVYFIGDSLERRALDWFCHSTGFTSYSGLFPNGTGQGWFNCWQYRACPHVCSQDSINFRMSNAFLFGLLPDSSLLPRTVSHIPFPQTLDPLERLILYLEYQKQVDLDHPDMVVIGTGLWDLMHFTRLHLLLNRHEKRLENLSVLDPQLFSRWATFLSDQFLPMIQSLYPKSHLYIRTLPSTPQNRLHSGSWGLFDLMIQQNQSWPMSNMFHDRYIDALNQRIKYIVSRRFPNIGILDWYKITHGNLNWTDDVHPDSKGYKDYMNMVLYELKNMA